MPRSMSERRREAGLARQGQLEFRDGRAGQVEEVGPRCVFEVNYCVEGTPFPPELNVGLFIERRCQEHGAILRALGDTLTAAPPLIINASEIEQILRIIGRALDETYDHARKQDWISGTNS